LSIKILTPIERHNHRVIQEYNSLLDGIQNEKALIFMNHGYYPLKIELDYEDQKWKHQISLYNNMLIEATKLGLPDRMNELSFLEVGSGRGGGLSFIKKYYNPKIALGVDLNENQVDFCNKTHARDGLSFNVGDACNLDIANEKMDVIVNVESSHCYANINNFYSEVSRILKKNGLFLYTDIFFPDEVLYKKLLNFDNDIFPNMEILYATDMTQNVIKACNIDKVGFKSVLPKEIADFMAKISEEKEERYLTGRIKYVTIIAKKC
jgi:SAM-dependent methyltransferase